MDSPGLKRRLTCILATDAVGFSRLVSEDEGNALRILAAHRAVIDGIIAFHSGRIVSTAGDSVLAEFHSVVDAVRCAVEMQDALKTRNDSLPEAQRMHFRIGINLGEVVVNGDDLLGDGVNIAARLEGLAQPGGILISSSVYDQITGKLDLGFHDIGEQSLKNITRPIRAFRVSGTGGMIRTEPGRGMSPTAPNRALPIAIAAIAVAAVAGGVAWVQGWIGGSRGTEVRVAVPDPTKVKLEAELAASEKARVDAEQRARSADATASKTRSEAELAALRAKAETDAAATKAKAVTEAAAIRAQAMRAQEETRTKTLDAEAIKAREEADAAALKQKAESEAAALRAKAEVETAAATAKEKEKEKEKADAAAALKASAAAPGYDGAWVATYKCSAVGPQPPFTRTDAIVVTGGEFIVQRGIAGDPGYNIATGRTTKDGTLVMTGNGINPQGRKFDIRFDGRWNGDRFLLHGPFGQRTCDVEIARPVK